MAETPYKGVLFRRVTSGSPGVLEYVMRGGLLVTTIGVCFLAFSGFLFLVAASLALEAQGGWTEAAWPAMGAFVIVLPGLFGAVGRWGFRIDTTTRTVACGSGLLRPWWFRTWPLDSFRGVATKREFAPAPRGGGGWVHAVYLVGSGKVVRLCARPEEDVAATIAADVAAHAGLSRTEASA